MHISSNSPPFKKKRAHPVVREENLNSCNDVETDEITEDKCWVVPARSFRWSRVGIMGGLLLCKKNSTMRVSAKFVIQAPGMLLVMP